MKIQSNTLVLDNQSMSSSWTGAALSLRNAIGYSITVTVSGGSAPTGTFTLEGSNDNDNLVDHLASGTWVTITGSSQTISDNGSITWNDSNSMYRRVRVKYARTSGTGSADVNFNFKGW